MTSLPHHAPRSAEAASSLVRVSFRLERDADGYPPSDWESMWAAPVGPTRYKIDNTPFFVPGISLGDVVEAFERVGELVFEALVERSPNSTVRVVGIPASELPEIRARLTAIGCVTEQSHLKNLMAVDVPADVRIQDVQAILNAEAAAGRIDFEESALRHEA